MVVSTVRTFGFSLEVPLMHKEQTKWKEAILADIEKLINSRLAG